MAIYKALDASPSGNIAIKLSAWEPSKISPLAPRQRKGKRISTAAVRAAACGEAIRMPFWNPWRKPGNRRWILREMMYFWYYFRLQFEQIFKYRVLGMVLGSVISVFLRKAFTGYSARWVKRSWALRGFLRQAYWGLPLRCAYTERFPLRHPSPKAV